MKTSPFTVVYQFRCPLCKGLNVGELTYEATDPANASCNLRNHAPACEFCSPIAPTMATVRTLVFLPLQNEAEQV
jgi:hypothetical protein